MGRFRPRSANNTLSGFDPDDLFETSDRTWSFIGDPFAEPVETVLERR